MPEGLDGPLPSDVEVVRNLMAAIAEDRLYEVKALVHPDAVWMALARPGLTQYRGHDGMARFLADIHAAYGPFRVDISEIVPFGDNKVKLVAQAVQLSQPDEQRLPPAMSTFTLVEGQVIHMEAS